MWYILKHALFSNSNSYSGTVLHSYALSLMRHDKQFFFHKDSFYCHLS